MSEYNCNKCGDTGSVRVHSHEDYGISFECEYCQDCELGQSLIQDEQKAWQEIEYLDDPIADE